MGRAQGRVDALPGERGAAITEVFQAAFLPPPPAPRQKSSSEGIREVSPPVSRVRRRLPSLSRLPVHAPTIDDG